MSTKNIKNIIDDELILSKKFNTVSRYLSGLVMLLAVLALIGWFFDVAVFKTFLSTGVPMKVTTLICFILSGLAMSLYQWRKNDSTINKNIIRICAFVIFIISFSTFFDYIHGYNFGIDQFLFKMTDGAETISFPERMAFYTAINFILISIILFILDLKKIIIQRIVEAISLFIFFSSFVFFTAYIYGSTPVFILKNYLVAAMSFNSSVALIILSISIIFSTSGRLMKIIANKNIGGVIFRRMFPVVLFIPIMLGWLALYINGLKIIDEEPVVAVLNVFFIVIYMLILSSFLNTEDSERRKAENLLVESEDKFHSLFNNSEVGMFRSRLDGSEVLDANKKYLSILGMKREEFVGKPSVNIWSDFNERVKMVNKLRIYGHVENFEFKLVNKAGQIRNCLTSLRLYPETNILEGSIQDITERKQAEEALRQSEEKLRIFVDFTYDWEYLDDVSGNLVYMSPSCERISGYKVEEFTNDNLLIKKIIHPDDLVAFENHYNHSHITNGAKPLEIDFRIIKKNGDVVNMSHLCAPVYNNNGVLIGRRMSNRDVTSRVIAEKNVLEIKSRDEAILDSIGDAVFATDKNGTIVIFNKMSEILTGVSVKVAIGQHYQKVLNFIDETTGRPVMDFVERAVNSNRTSQIIRSLILIRKDGFKIPVADSAAPIHDLEKNIIGCVVVFHDITKEKEIDKAKTEFLSIASHQLRTPLSITKWVLEALMQDPKKTNKQSERFSDLIASNERLITLVNDLLNVSLIETGKIEVSKKDVKISEIFSTLQIHLKILADKKNKNIEFNSSTDLKTVYCDPFLIHEALENLITNAINYSPVDSNKIKVMIRSRKIDYLISVHNNGVINPESAAKIKTFGKFVRGEGSSEKEPSGSGLGLYITKKVVEEMGGNLWFETNIKSGTIFYITLPKKKFKK